MNRTENAAAVAEAARFYGYFAGSNLSDQALEALMSDPQFRANIFVIIQSKFDTSTTNPYRTGIELTEINEQAYNRLISESRYGSWYQGAREFAFQRPDLGLKTLYSLRPRESSVLVAYCGLENNTKPSFATVGLMFGIAATTVRQQWIRGLQAFAVEMNMYYMDSVPITFENGDVLVTALGLNRKTVYWMRKNGLHLLKDLKLKQFWRRDGVLQEVENALKVRGYSLD